MKHLFTVLAWAVPAAGLLIACTSRPAAPPLEKAPALEVSGTRAPAAEPEEILDIPGTVLVHFDLGQAEPHEEPALDAAAAALRQDGGLHARIEGHACPLGPDAVNERLGLRRAAAVKGWMEAAGVPASHLVAESLGARRPVAQDPALYHLNRRATITFWRNIP